MSRAEVPLTGFNFFYMVDEFGGRGLRIPSMQLELCVPQGSVHRSSQCAEKCDTIYALKGDPLQRVGVQ